MVFVFSFFFLVSCSKNSSFFVHSFVCASRRKENGKRSTVLRKLISKKQETVFSLKKLIYCIFRIQIGDVFNLTLTFLLIIRYTKQYNFSVFHLAESLQNIQKNLKKPGINRNGFDRFGIAQYMYLLSE